MTIAAETTLCPRCKEDLSSYLAMKPDLGFCLFCQFPLMPVAGKYRLMEVLGEGGFGMVYRAMHLTMHRDAERVVKVMKPEVMEQPGMKERFLREVQTTSALSQRNPHIVRVFDDFGEIPRLGYFYVMEFLKGVPLTDAFADRQNLPPVAWCLDVFGQLCDAMQAAHEEHIVHRDLKPDNIFLIQHRRRDNFVKVLDFGIAKPLDSATSTGGHKTQGLLGTPFYVAPEQISNAANLDHRADIYAMGIILHEMLTGQIPLIDPQKMKELTLLQLISMRMMSDKIPSLRIIRPDRGIPEGVDLAVQKALSRDPEQRHTSVEAFWAALEPFQGDDEGYTLQKEARIAGLNPASQSAHPTPPKNAIALDHTGQMDLNTPRSTPAIRVSQHGEHPPLPEHTGPLPTATEADMEAIDEETMALLPAASSSARRATPLYSPPPSENKVSFGERTPIATRAATLDQGSPIAARAEIRDQGSRPAPLRSATLDQALRSHPTPPHPQALRSLPSRATLGGTADIDALRSSRLPVGLFLVIGLIVAGLGVAYAMGLFSNPPTAPSEKIAVAIADAGATRWVPFPDMEVQIPEAKSTRPPILPESNPQEASPEPQPERTQPQARTTPRRKTKRRKNTRRRPTKRLEPTPPRPTPIRTPPVVQKASPCPNAILMTVSPRVRISDILLSGNKKPTKSSDGKGFCIPKGIKKASLSHPGFHECQFTIPQKTQFRVRMREQSDDVVEMDYCLSK